MPYNDYRDPGVTVTLERLASPQSSGRTLFLPVFIGTGSTSRNRIEAFTRIKGNVSAFPVVTFDYDIVGNVDMFNDTDFKAIDFRLHKELEAGEPVTPLALGTDYEVVEVVALRESSSTYRTTIRVLDVEKVTPADLYFDFKLSLENTNEDFVPRLLTRDQQYQTDLFLGPKTLNEGGTTIRNDIAIAAEIAFRLNVPQFYYLEVPRDYGTQPTKSDFQKVIEELYFVNDIYRVVPLTYDLDIIRLVSTFATSVANPNDKRQMIAFTATDPSLVTDKNDILSWIEAAGLQSEALNNPRAFNVAGITDIDLLLDGVRHNLPLYFLAVAVAAYDTVSGMNKPISTEVLSVFTSVKSPRFRPKVWGQLARYGVFVCYKDTATNSNGVVIHHQLSTSQSDSEKDQELSVIKNVDAATVRMRDWFVPYAGRVNITDELLVKLNATMAQAIEDITKTEKFMTTLEIVTPWQKRTMQNTTNGVTESKTSLVTRLSGEPASPANNLDIILAI